MAESIRFDFLSSGADRLARDFKNTGDNAAAAARGAKVLSSTIEQLGQKENRTAAESATLAKALKLTGDAEDRAAAKALAADIAIRRLDDAMADSSKSSDKAGGGFLGLTGAVTGFSDASTAASSKSTLFQKSLAGINLATGVLEPALAGVVVAVGGLAAGFAAAGAGLGVFGVVAQSVFAEASKAATTYATAQAKYDSATTSAQRTSALKAEKAAFVGLSPPVKTLAVELGNVQNKWKAFTDAAAPGVVSVITQGLGLLPKVLAAMKPFLAPVEAALHGIITQLATGLNSAGFKSFIDLLAKNTGPAITKIAAAIGNVIVGIGGILKAFLPTSQSLLSGVDKITAKFREWGTTLSAGTGFQSLMATFKTETPQAVAILKNLGTVLVNVGKAVTGLSGVGNSKALLQALLPLSGVLASLSKNTDLDRIVLYLIAARSAAVKLGPAFLGIKAAVAFFPSAWAAIVKFSGAVEGAAAKEVIAGAAAKVWAGAQAVLNAVMDANPIVLVAAAVAALATGFVIAWKKSSLFRDIIKDIGKVFLQFGILWVQETKVIVDTFLNMVGIVIRGAADAFGWVPGLGGKLKGASTAFTNWKNSVSGDLDKVIGNMRGWQKELDASKQTTDAATSAIVKDMTRAGGSAVIARDDVATYTRAVQDNGAKSNAARSARANLIRDLENAGVHAGTANRLVNNLQGAINKMHGKTVSVGVHGSGSGGVQVTPSTGFPGAKKYSVYFTPLAAGGRIPGFGGGDQHPALLESGEAVVDKHRTRQYAPVLKAMGVPGMASGGLVGAVGSIGAAGAADGASGARANISAYVAYLKKLAAQFVATLVPNVGSGVARWKGTVDKALRLEGLSTAFDSRVLYQMQTECVTLDTVILTRRGWLKHDAVRPGDETIGYNPATGLSEWTPVTAVHHYDAAPTVRYGNQYWNAEFTPNHRWLAERVVRRPAGQQPLTACPECGVTGGRRGPFPSQRALQIHRAREHAITGARHGAPTAEVVSAPELIRFEGREKTHRLILARKADTGPGLPITEREASLLGWIAGDGNVQRKQDGWLNVNVYQSKPQFFTAIDYACGADPHYSRHAERASRGPGRKPSTQWHITSAYARDLFTRAGDPKTGAVAMVLAMSASQRNAWLEAVLLSEGSWSDGKITYWQNAGEIADAIEIAVYLEGHRPGRSERLRAGKTRVAITETAPYVGGPSRRDFTEDAGVQPVWCVTTELGTWTARNGSGAFLTGNSGGNPNAINLTDINAQHGDPSRGLMQVIGSTFRAYHWPGTSSNIYDPLANIAAAINYAKHVYGPQLGNQYGGIGSGHGYASGTASATPGWAWVGERGPELVRFRGGEQVRPAQAIPGGAAGGGGVHLHLTVNGPVGSQQQLEDWYVRTANKLAQHGRLTQAVKTASR